MLKITRHYLWYLKTRVSTWIVLGLFLAAVLSLAIVFSQSDSGTLKDMIATEKRINPDVLHPVITDAAKWPQSEFNTVWTLFGPLICVLFSGIFISTKAANIFSDGESNGTELIILSKPFTRKQIAAGKFFTMFLISLGASLIISLLTLISLSSPLVSGVRGMHLFVNTFVGTLFIQILFSSVCILLSLVVGPRATIALGITVTFVPYVLSVIVGPLTGKELLAKKAPDAPGIYRLSIQGMDTTAEQSRSEPKTGYATAKWFDIFEHWQNWYNFVGDQPKKGTMRLDKAPYKEYHVPSNYMDLKNYNKMQLDAKAALKWWMAKEKTIQNAFDDGVTGYTPGTVVTSAHGYTHIQSGTGTSAKVRGVEIRDQWLATKPKLLATYGGDVADADSQQLSDLSSTISSYGEFLTALEKAYTSEFAKFNKGMWKDYMNKLDSYKQVSVHPQSVFSTNWLQTPVEQADTQHYGMNSYKLTYWHSEEIVLATTIFWILMTLGLSALAWRLYGRKDYN